MVRWGSKWGGSQPRTRRIPPRLGVPASAPQSGEGVERGQADSVTPAARPAWSNLRRLTPWVLWGCCVLIETLPGKYTSLRLPVQPCLRILGRIPALYSGRETACPVWALRVTASVNSIYLT